MTSCTNCGNELGVGRFCTNCGQPIEWRTDTAERAPVPAPPNLPPPAPADLPPKPRFPLFADEVPAIAPIPRPRAEQPGQLPPPPPAVPAPHRRGSGPWLAWLAVAAVLILVAGVGFRLLTSGDDDEGSTASDNPSSTQQPSDPPQSSSAPPAAQPGELAAQAEVAVPATAPPNQDVSGNQVRYDGANMLDGVPDTAWRMPGDGTGEEITLTLPAETRLRSVGIVNGYAKAAQDAKGRELDWYHGNRRVLSVEWVFDDGNTVVQDLDDTTELQSVDVDATTTTVTVRLVEVSQPGKGPAARDYTAISDLSVVGR